MVWFECQCGDTIKKPKVQAHLQRCHAQYLTCVDCSQDFSRYDVQVGHCYCGRQLLATQSCTYLLLYPPVRRSIASV